MYPNFHLIPSEIPLTSETRIYFVKKLNGNLNVFLNYNKTNYKGQITKNKSGNFVKLQERKATFNR